MAQWTKNITEKNNFVIFCFFTHLISFRKTHWLTLLCHFEIPLGYCSSNCPFPDSLEQSLRIAVIAPTIIQDLVTSSTTFKEYS